MRGSMSYAPRPQHPREVHQTAHRRQKAHSMDRKMPAPAGSGIKEWAWRVFEVVFWTLVVVSAIGSFISWITGADRGKLPEGQRCGPNHHWGYIRSGQHLELSCEPDR
jgi:hypothetical protein